MFHSLYGTFDYRASVFDLRRGRDELRQLIGPASEEIAFLICTSDRINLMYDLLNTLYGKNAKSALGGGLKIENDGNPYPPRQNVTLNSDGYPVTNHITRVIHLIPPTLFADFCIVMIADFMEQGALGLGSEDQDICLFNFLRYRFYSDLLLFIKPYIRILPKVWFDYLCENDYKEPLREEVIFIKRMWLSLVCPTAMGVTSSSANRQSQLPKISQSEKEYLGKMVLKYEYLIEPRVVLACALEKDELLMVCNIATLIK